LSHTKDETTFLAKAATLNFLRTHLVKVIALSTICFSKTLFRKHKKFLCKHNAKRLIH